MIALLHSVLAATLPADLVFRLALGQTELGEHHRLNIRNLPIQVGDLRTGCRGRSIQFGYFVQRESDRRLIRANRECDTR